MSGRRRVSQLLRAGVACAPALHPSRDAISSCETGRPHVDLRASRRLPASRATAAMSRRRGDDRRRRGRRRRPVGGSSAIAATADVGSSIDLRGTSTWRTTVSAARSRPRPHRCCRGGGRSAQSARPRDRRSRARTAASDAALPEKRPTALAGVHRRLRASDKPLEGHRRERRQATRRQPGRRAARASAPDAPSAARPTVTRPGRSPRRPATAAVRRRPGASLLAGSPVVTRATAT